MEYKRHAEGTIRKLAGMFGAVLVTGARQVGKTTLLQQMTRGVTYVTLDDKLQLAAAVTLSGTFFKDHTPPVFVDEIQYAPELFPQMKIIIDREKKKGLFYLSGSQQFRMMKHVSESLAGRLGILQLPGLSLREQSGAAFSTPFLPTDAYFSTRKQEAAPMDYATVWRTIHRGSMPELCAHPEFDWQMFYAAYIKTYIERDVRDLAQVGDEIKFLRFMTAAAACTGQLLNVASLARDVGVSPPTAERWLSILAASHLICLLPPYHNNVLKRAVKTPKLYFLDTGLAAYLTRWNTPETLKSGAMAGAFFETFVVSELIKGYANAGVLDLPLYFYRDKEGHEIDVLIETDGTLYPLEIKKHADPDRRDAAQFALLDKIPNTKRGPGGVICLYDSLVTLQDTDRVIPVHLL
jgi:predicted AAA+ superfamily ATPase